MTNCFERFAVSSWLRSTDVMWSVNAMHLTASVFVNDDESDLLDDYERWLEQLVPHEPVSQYLHNRMGEDN